MNTENDSTFLNSIDDLKASLNNDPVQLNQVKYQIDKAMKMSGKAELDYLNALMHPETERGVKIPSQIPVPSATFHLKASCDLKTNASGNLWGHLHPWFLGDDSYKGQRVMWSYGISSRQAPPVQVSTTSMSQEIRNDVEESQQIGMDEDEDKKIDISKMLKDPFAEEDKEMDIKPKDKDKLKQTEQVGYLVKGISTLFFYNQTDLNGTTAISNDDYISVIDIGQSIPAGVYDQYRLVSASMRIIYTGPLDEAAGVIGGAIVFGDRENIVGCQVQLKNYIPDGNTFDSYSNGREYSVFNRLRYAPYFRENNILEGLRMLYFPIDNKSNEFCPLVGRDRTFMQTSWSGVNAPLIASDYMRDFGWYFYVQGGPKQKSFRLEMDCNFEVLPNAKVLNYMPIYISPEYIKPAILKKIYHEVMQKALGKCKCLNKII